MSTFRQSTALQAFRTFLNGKGLNEATLTVSDGFEAMLEFYETVRASDCTSESADMLLFQWGTYDRTGYPRPGGGTSGVVFDINLVRQLIPDVQEDDEDIWQLELNFELDPTDTLRALGDGDKWCGSLLELRAFRDYVLTSPSFQLCSELPVRHRMLLYTPT